MIDESPAERLAALREHYDLHPSAAEQLEELKEAVAALEQQRTTLAEELQKTNQGLLELTTELQEAERRYRRLFETAAEGIYTIDEEVTAYELVNPAMAEILGYASRDQLRGAVEHVKTDVFVSPQRYEEYRSTLLDTGRLSDFEYQVQTAADEHRWVSDSAVTITDEDGTTTGYRGGLIDITKRKQNEDQLRQFRQATEAAGNAIFLIDTDGDITYVNPAFEEITGYSAEEVRGEPLSILDSNDSPLLGEQLWETIRTDGRWQGRLINQRKSGEYYHARQTIASITDETGAVQQFVGVQTDITRAVERERQISALDQVMRHNIRNSLNVIKGKAELAIEESPDEPIETIAHEIIETADQLVKTAEEGREITRLLAGQTSRGAQSITTVVRDVITTMETRYPEATIEADLEEATAVVVGSFDQAVAELVENAIMHNDADDPRVVVTLEAADETVRLTVVDNGPGIPAFDRHVFGDPDSGDELSHGSGLGLWLVYWIVHRSGGTLEYEESPEGGSSITVQVPRPDQSDLSAQ